jgi:alpha-L-fucosidase
MKSGQKFLAIDRRFFLKTVGAGLAVFYLPSCSQSNSIPSFLMGYENLYQTNPRKAALEWFRNAKFGLFIHYGLYSLLENHEWVQLRQKIRVSEYAKLKDRFTAEKFDPDFITDLALEAEMKYVNLVTRHHDSFSLWDTKQNDFNSVNSPAKRDLVGEMAEQCRKKGLGFFCYYSHGRDWKHPHAPHNENWRGRARPEYDPPESTYKTGENHDLQKYIQFIHNQIAELLTNYGPLAGIWLDGIAVPRSNLERLPEFRCQELYDYIHNKQPQVLVSYKQGLLGTEDFFAPEHKALKDKTGKPMEICTTLQNGGWGYVKNADHLTVDEVVVKLSEARKGPANLLLNTGPLGDGSIHPEDVKTLKEIGRRIRADGWPGQ